MINILVKTLSTDHWPVGPTQLTTPTVPLRANIQKK